ncbi:unnamed protein product [Periconia digitata]|uniref:Secreted protein n=1 Tax=Periconia digitata TaxID=1303443 RepID=A0A9W4U413_9PLEO|nr:unnamed protein product [Periconia digitata]
MLCMQVLLWLRHQSISRLNACYSPAFCSDTAFWQNSLPHWEVACSHPKTTLPDSFAYHNRAMCHCCQFYSLFLFNCFCFYTERHNVELAITRLCIFTFFSPLSKQVYPRLRSVCYDQNEYSPPKISTFRTCDSLQPPQIHDSLLTVRA